jgi:hypothetical protein
MARAAGAIGRIVEANKESLARLVTRGADGRRRTRRRPAVQARRAGTSHRVRSADSEVMQSSVSREE